MENFSPEDNRFTESGEMPPHTGDGHPNLNPKIAPVTASVIGLIAVFILYQVGGSALTIAILGFNLKNADITSVRLLTVAGQLLFILLPALILSRYVYTDVTYILRFRPTTVKNLTLFTVGLLILSPLLQSYLYIQNVIIVKLAGIMPFFAKFKEFIDTMDKVVEESYSAILASHSPFETILIIFVVAVIPAVCEEIFFRGYVQKGFELKTTAFKSALLTAVFFAMYHFHPYQIVPLAALGLYFGYAVYMTDSIFTAVFLHFINNLSAVVIYFIFGSDDITVPKNVTAAETTGSLFMFVFMSVLFALFIVYLNKMFSKQYN